MKKAIFTLDVDGYSPEITEITFPLMRYYARKIGAEFHMITERKFPGWPVEVEKLQLRGSDADWTIFFDADAMVHPECPDWTTIFPEDTCVHNGEDFAPMRHRYDGAHSGDGRHIGTCGWFILVPKACLSIFDPPDMTVEEAVSRCWPTVPEANSGMKPEHLVDDYLMSRNIAKNRLKHDTILEYLKRTGKSDWQFFWHNYTIGKEEKVRQMHEILWGWKVPHPVLFQGREWFFERMK